MANYKVVEIFNSINGEGIRAGQLAVFIRMQGCNLNCAYCDTKWANEADARFRWTSTEENCGTAPHDGDQKCNHYRRRAAASGKCFRTVRDTGAGKKHCVWRLRQTEAWI